MPEFSSFDEYLKTEYVPEDTFYPCPDNEYIHFIEYLLKRHGGLVKLSYCEKRWGREFDVQDVVKQLNKERSRFLREVLNVQGTFYCIGVGIAAKEKQIKIRDTKWASFWVKQYECEPPHHAQFIHDWKPKSRE